MTELCTSIMMLWWWVCNDYMRCMSVCQSIRCLYNSAISHPDNTIMVIVFSDWCFCWLLFLFHWCYVHYFLHIFSRFLTMTVLDIECLCIGLFVTGSLTMFVLLLLVPGCLSNWFKMFSNGSVLICLCRLVPGILFSWNRCWLYVLSVSCN